VPGEKIEIRNRQLKYGDGETGKRKK